MSVYQKFATFPQDFLSGYHDFTADTFYMALTNVLPNAALDVDIDDIVQVAEGNGYGPGGAIIPNIAMGFVGVDTVVYGDPVIFVAAGGSIGPFQHAVMYNGVGLRRLVSYWSYPESIYLLDTETLTVTFNVDDGIFKII